MTRSLYDHAHPRQDVLSGVIADTIFAASLDEVAAGTAPATYGNATMFFAGTHPSTGLKSLLAEVFGRVTGVRPDAPAVIRLETNLGGGKTHNLIAVYHVARGGLQAATANEFMDAALIPPSPVRVGVFVGTESGATSFSEQDGVKPRTVWGHLALAIGGKAAYEEVRQDDEQMTAPGSGALGRVLGDQPAIILIDELARYLAVAGGVAVGETTLATQTVAFLMSLIEAVSAKANVSLVLTSTQVTDAFGDETGEVLKAVADAMSLVARKEHVLRPSDEADLPAILARRLFERIDRDVCSDVGSAYEQAATAAIDQNVELPDGMRAGWASEVEKSYPFHPDLISVLDKRLSTIPNFQRTRGALRLLARTVREMWDKQPSAELIHLHHIDLADSEIAEDLSSRLDRATFEPVIRADIASQPGGDPSHAEDVDVTMAAGAPFARRVATAAYIWSLTRDIPGAPAGTLVGSVLSPGDDPNVISKALDLLEQRAWYLSVDTRGYRFSTEASLPKLIQEAESQVLPSRANVEATDILTKQYKDSAFTVRRIWEDAKIPDRDNAACLAVLSWEEFGPAHGVTKPEDVPRQIQEMWEKKPDGGIREYRNRIVFLVPSAATHDAMVRAVRKKLALSDLLNSTETLRGLTDEKRRQLDDMAKESDLEARVAVCNHVNVLYVPAKGGLEGSELDTVTTASVKKNQTDSVLDRLAVTQKTLAAGDPPLDPGVVTASLGQQLKQAISTAELVKAFASRTDLRIVLDQAQIQAVILAGVKSGRWEYEDPVRGESGWATKQQPTASVRIAADTFIHPVGSAPAPKEEEIPVLKPPPKRAVAKSGFTATGKADVAVAQARQEAADAKVSKVAEIRVSINDVGSQMGVELAKLLTVVPPGTPGVTLRYEIDVKVDLGVPGDTLEIRFSGPANAYTPVKAAVDQVLRSNQAVVEATVGAKFEQPVDVGGQELEEVHRRAGDTGPAKCVINFVPEEQA